MNINPTNAYMNPRLVGMRLPTSLWGRPIPLLEGTQRLAWQLLWYNDFTAKSAASVQGGKGGLGPAGKGQSYVYYSAIAALLCAGPVQKIGRVWDSQGILLIQTGQTQVVIPSVGPYTVVVTPPGTASYASDIGAARADAYSVTQNDYGSPGAITYAGTQQTPMVQVAASPDVGEYTLVVNPGPPATGTYTFNPGDAGKTVTISYAWQDPSAITGAKTDPGSILDLTLFVGNQGQSPWGFVTTNFPTQARGYTLAAYVANPSIYLGPSGELPGFTFEILARNIFGGGIVDCSPYDGLLDVLIDPNYGLGWNPADFDLGNIGQTWENWKNYCVANGLFISLLLNSQETAASICDRVLKITNSEMVCDGPIIKMVTYGDTTAVGNGATFIPNTTPIVDFDDDDYLTDAEPGEEVTEDPLQIKIPTVLDAFNNLYLEYLDRANDYDPSVIPATDDASIAQIGVRTMPSLSMHDITSQPVAALVASLVLQRSVNIRAQYMCKVGMQYRYLLPMDMITVTDPVFGSLIPARILSIEENENWELSLVAEEFPWGTATPSLYPKQNPGGGGVNSAANPGDVNPPIILEANNRVTGQAGYELWFCVSGEVLANWGGCHIWMSADGVEYQRINDINGNGSVNGASRMGVLASNFSAGTDPDELSIVAGNLTRSGGVVTGITIGSIPWAVGDLVRVPDPVSFAYIVTPLVTVAGSTFTVNYPGANATSTITKSVMHAVEIDLTQSGSDMQSGSASDADNDRTLCAIISSGVVELVSYATADLVSQSDYNLSYIRRGQLTSVDAAHVAGDAFIRLDSSIFRYQFDPSLIGQTLYFKFTSFNTANQMEQSLADVNPYTVTPLGTFKGVTDLSLGTNLSTTGSVPATLNGPMTYVSTTSSISWTWTGMYVTRADGTVTNVPNGSLAVTGLTAATPYYFYPYYDEILQSIQFVTGGSGTPAVAQAAPTILLAQQASLSNRVPLATGNVPASTTSSGSGGGSGGGSGPCLSHKMYVETREGIKEIGHVIAGEEVLGPDGWTTVVKNILVSHEVFIRIELEDGCGISVTPTHPFEAMDALGNLVDVMAKEITVSHLLFTRRGAQPVAHVDVIKASGALKAIVTCQPSPRFYAGEETPDIQAHNVRPIS